MKGAVNRPTVKLLDPAEADRRIARLASYDLTWIEEPVPQENLSGHAKVRATSPIPYPRRSPERGWPAPRKRRRAGG